MTMAWLWTVLVVASLIFGAVTGNLGTLGDAAIEGATSAVQLCISMAGITCLWTGVMEIMNQCGISQKLAHLFRPLLRRLLPQVSRDEQTLSTVSANLSANMLGLGNAATPLGIRAARRMARGTDGIACDDLCTFIVLNTASIQLLPTTVAGLRTTFGAVDAFDILPAVWLASALSVSAGIAAAKLLQRRRR